MKSLSLQLSHANILGMTIYPEKDIPRVIVNLGLYAANGKSIGTVSLDSCAVYDNHFTVSPGLALSVRGLLDELEGVVTQHCQKLAAELPPVAEEA